MSALWAASGLPKDLPRLPKRGSEARRNSRAGTYTSPWTVSASSVLTFTRLSVRGLVVSSAGGGGGGAIVKPP